MTQAEFDEAINLRKAERQAKIDLRNETQADWVRCMAPVVKDDDVSGYRRVLKTMGIDEDRIQQYNPLYARLIDQGQRTLALVLWCQQRDPQQQLIRYITGLLPHEVEEDGSTTYYDPDVAVADNGMKVKLLQFLVKIGSNLTRKEAAAKSAELTAAQAKKAAKWAKNPRNPNNQGKGGHQGVRRL